MTVPTAAVPYRLLEAVPELGHGDQSSGNLLIQGDNLDALKALLPYYIGQVKCVYIDPPFNTGGAFPNYDDNMEHTIWISLFHKRLSIICELLADDGFICVNLDDHQAAYAKVIMDESLGRQNYICTITVEAATASSFKTANTGPLEVSQFILMYAKNKSNFLYSQQYLYTTDVDLGHYSRFVSNFDEDPERWEFKNIKQHIMDQLGVPPASHPATRYKHAKQHLGPAFMSTITSMANEFALENSFRVFETKTLQKPAPWLRSFIEKSLSSDKPICLKRDEMNDLVLLGGRQIYFLSGSTKLVGEKSYIAKPITTIWNDIPTNNLQSEGGVSFPSGKKPEALVRRVIQMGGLKRGDVVLGRKLINWLARTASD